jgi:signal transduction histidine kinase
MSEGGDIDIVVRSYRDETPQGNWVEIVFSDSGAGIPGELMHKIFNPFYTTREKGTGLGLAIVHNIVESHRGTIEARSVVGRGTTFMLSFPRAGGGERRGCV